MDKTKYLSAFERGMVVGARFTDLCQELELNDPPPKGHPANLTQLYTTLLTKRKYIDDIVSSVTISTYPNQRPWIKCNIRTELKARAAA
jgi:hypothetical protein